MTASEVTILSRAGRIEEIMRMTSGTQQTESARENAKELLAMAEKEKQHFGN
jgi:DNA repair protein RecN (Recombination protein N)